MFAYQLACMPVCLSISLLSVSHPLTNTGTQTVHEHIQTTVHTQKKNKHKHGINKTTAITTTTPTNNAKRHIAATSHFFPSLSVCPSTRREKDAADERVDPVSKLRRAAADTSKPETRSVGGSQSLGFVSYLKWACSHVRLFFNVFCFFPLFLFYAFIFFIYILLALSISPFSLSPPLYHLSFALSSLPFLPFLLFPSLVPF